MAGLILGGVAFTGFEIPNKINFGGEQKTVVHQLIGGGRVIDAMGPSPDVISWEGRFRGLSAISRAQAVDEMRMAGTQVDLSWLNVFRSVVIKTFKAETEKAYEVPYQITCEVVQESAASLGGLFQTLDSLIGADISAATGYSGGSSVADAAVTAFAASLATIGPLTGAPASSRVAASLAANTAVVSLRSVTASLDAGLGQPIPVGDPNAIAAWLAAQTTSGAAQSRTYDILAYVQRAGSNIAVVRS